MTVGDTKGRGPSPDTPDCLGCFFFFGMTLDRGRGLYTAEPDPPFSRMGPGAIHFDLQEVKKLV